MTTNDMESDWFFNLREDHDLGQTHLSATELEMAARYGQAVGVEALGSQLDELSTRLVTRRDAGATDEELAVIQNELDFTTFALRITPVANVHSGSILGVDADTVPNGSEDSEIRIGGILHALQRARAHKVRTSDADTAVYADSPKREVAEQLGNDLAAARVAIRKRRGRRS